ncbi:MAG: hypothetical protein MI923_07150 [Phycisphaerales bacterium]|nr:hypothetical protein [Phycisphaerales bacterium]
MYRLGLHAILLTLLSVGCATSPQIGPMPIDPDDQTDLTASSESTDNEVDTNEQNDQEPDCTRFIITRSGNVVCLDELLAALLATNPRDNDGDGIPNLNDDDIDGDGIPNGFDLDVDGDGLPNSTDDDIDDDGVSNAEDVDIDGDFLRNRWDPDMDADLLYNPRDPDADGDGLEKRIALPNPDCGPVQLFNDPDECTGECGDDSNDDGAEDKCNDKGPNDEEVNLDATGQNVAIEDMNTPEADQDDPTAREIALFGDGLETLFADGDEIIEDFMAADPDATPREIFDAVLRELEEAADAVEPEGEPGGGLLQPLSEDAADVLQERRDAVVSLAELQDVAITEAVDLTGRFSAAVMNLRATLGNLVETTRAIDNSLPGKDLFSDAEMATAFTEIAVTSDLPDTNIAEAIAPTVQTAQVIGNEEVLESVWRIVVDQVDEYRDDDDGLVFSLPKVALAVEHLAALLDQPTIETVNDSIANVLAATAARDLRDPLAVVEKLEVLSGTEPGFSVADGISENEAALGAEEVDNDNSN